MRGPHSVYNYRVLRVCTLLLLAVTMYGQDLTVLDENGTPLIGVEVYTDDLSFGDVTDSDGKVSIAGLSDQQSIYLRYLGYKTIKESLSRLRSLGFSINMTVDQSMLEELVVLGRRAVEASDIPYQVSSISIKDIQSQEAQTSADALGQHGSVYVQKSQLGGGSPVIRGFEASRVLLVVDNVRLNNAIYRNGHLQSAITVDQAMLDRMDVIYGPNSLMYGSDALGGVVNFKTRDPLLSDGPDDTAFSGNFYTRYASANEERSAHVDLSYGKEKWGSLTSLTYSKYGDLRTGSNRDERFPDFGKRLIYQGIDNAGNDITLTNDRPDVQVGSGYNQFDLLQKILFVPNTEQRITANIQYSTSTDIPRYDNLSEIRDGQLRWGEWYYGPQTRFLASLDYRHLKQTKAYDQLILIGSFQHIDEDRITRLFGNPMRQEQNEDVSVFGLTIDASKSINEQLEVSYGADVQHNIVVSDVSMTNLQTGEVTMSGLSRYASGTNDLTHLGAYISLEGTSTDELHHINGGLRYTQTTSELSYERSDPVVWPSSFYDGLTNSNSAITFSLGSSHQLLPTLLVKSMLGTAFRSPNIDDLSKIRINSDEITFPNLDLEPERSINAEITIGYKPSDVVSISGTAFYTRLSNAIVRRDFTAPDGSPTWDSQGDILRVVANQNLQKGRIQGLSINLNGQISKSLSYLGSLNLISGREITDSETKEPLAHIPPVYGRFGVKYEHDKWSSQLNVRYNGAKDIALYGGSVDNPDLATPIGALSWTTLNIYGNYRFTESVSLSLSAENLLDLHYRPFAAGISAPGRNFILSVKGKF